MTRGSLWLFRVGFLVCISVVAVAGVIAFRAFQGDLSTYHPRHEQLPAPPRCFEAIEFPSEDQSVRGWYLAPTNGALIVYVHGTSADRRQLLPLAERLAKLGYGALLFDLPGHGESGGEVHWSAEARAAVLAALAFGASRPGVEKVTAFGFSMGGYIVSQIAGDAGRLSALILASTPDDGTELTRFQFGRWGVLSSWPALLADRMAGFDPRPLPSVALRKFKGPALVVYGDRDDVVPAKLLDSVARAPGGPTRVVVLSNFGHFDYLKEMPERFDRELTNFLATSSSAGRWSRPACPAT